MALFGTKNHEDSYLDGENNFDIKTLKILFDGENNSHHKKVKSLNLGWCQETICLCLKSLHLCSLDQYLELTYHLSIFSQSLLHLGEAKTIMTIWVILEKVKVVKGKLILSYEHFGFTFFFHTELFQSCLCNFTFSTLKPNSSDSTFVLIIWLVQFSSVCFECIKF